PVGQDHYCAPVGPATRLTDKGAAGTLGAPLTNSSATQSVTINAGDTALAVKSALETLVGVGNVDVQKAGGIYRIHFQSGMGGTPIPLLLTDPTLLTNGLGASDTLNIVDSGVATDDAAVLTSSSLTGLDMGSPNSIQPLVGTE